jgi:hypothetical protein
MSTYVTLPFNKKLNLLRDHDGSGGWDSLDDERWCLHCGKKFNGHAARVYEQDGRLWLECGTPECDGSPIDWAPYPWWDPKHPAAKAHQKKTRRAKRKPHLDSGAADDIPF